MKLREQIGARIIGMHILDSHFEPDNNGTNMGTAYYKIEPKWLKIGEKIAGTDFITLIKKYAEEN